jgi:hypothetical protein
MQPGRSASLRERAAGHSHAERGNEVNCLTYKEFILGVTQLILIPMRRFQQRQGGITSLPFIYGF